MTRACCERDTNQDGNCDRHPDATITLIPGTAPYTWFIARKIRLPPGISVLPNYEPWNRGDLWSNNGHMFYSVDDVLIQLRRLMIR